MDWPGFYLLLLTIFLPLPFGLAHGPKDLQQPVIKEHPSNVVAKRNDPVTLNCAVDYASEITWFKDGVKIDLEEDAVSSRKMIFTTGCSLFFLRVVSNKRESDAGTYWFEAKNRYGSRRSDNSTLIIATLSDAFFEPPNPFIKARQGHPLTLHCRPPRGKPAPTVSWKHDGHTITNSSRQFTTPDGDLVFEDVFETDKGIYVCVAENVAGSRESQPSQVLVMRSPYFEEKPQNLSTIAGSSVEFKCVARGNPSPSVSWTKLYGDLPRDRSTYSEEKSLHLKDVTFSDSGIYVCEARNEAGYVKATSVLKVVAAPSVIEKPMDLVVLEGKDIELKCRVEADPEPLIIWKLPFHGRDSLLMKSLISNKKATVTSDGTSLKVKKLRLDDSGIYQCWGISSGGGVSSSAKVVVVSALPPPIIGVLPQDQEVQPFSSVTFPCQVVSEASVASISWWFQEAAHLTARQLLPSKNSISILETGSLQLKKVVESNSGIYTCKVSSTSGNVEAQALLKVKTNPHRSSSRHGNLPAPPSKPRLVSIDETSVNLIWSPNSRMSASSDETYTVEYWRDPWQEWRVALTEIKGTSAIISQLSSNIAYVFLVKAVNRHGESFPSPWSDIVYTQLPQIRGILTLEDERQVKRKLNKPILVLTSVQAASEPDSVQLSWEALESSEIEVDGIIIYSVGDDAIKSTTVLGISSSSHIVKDLKPNTSYTFFVVPFWRTLEGVPSNAKVFVTPDQAPNAAPSGLKAEVSGPSSSLVRWEPLTGEGYVVAYKISISHNNKTRVEQTQNSWFEAKELVEGRFYTVKVAAINAGGVGPWSSPTLIDLTASSPFVKDTRQSDNNDPPSVMYAPPHPVWLLYLLVPVLIVVIILILFFFLRRVKNKSSASTLESSSTGGPAFYSTSDPPVIKSTNMYGDQQKLWRPTIDSDQDSSLSSAKLLHPDHIINEYAEPRVTHSSDGPYMMTAVLGHSSPRFLAGSGAYMVTSGRRYPEENLDINWSEIMPPPPSCPPPSGPPLHHSSVEDGGGGSTSASANTSDCSGDRRNYDTSGSSQYENAGDCESEQQYEKPCDMPGYCDDASSEHPYAVYTPLCKQNFQTFSTMHGQQPIQKIRVDLHPSRMFEPPKSNTH